MMRKLTLFLAAMVFVIGTSSCEKIIRGMIPEPVISMKIDGKSLQKDAEQNYFFMAELVKKEDAFGFYLRSGSELGDDSFKMVISYASDAPFELNKTYNMPARSETLDWDSFANVDAWPSSDEWMAEEGWIKITSLKKREDEGDCLIAGKYAFLLAKVGDPDQKIRIEDGSFEDISCEYWDYQDLK